MQKKKKKKKKKEQTKYKTKKCKSNKKRREMYKHWVCVVHMTLCFGQFAASECLKKQFLVKNENQMFRLNRMVYNLSIFAGQNHEAFDVKKV